LQSIFFPKNNLTEQYWQRRRQHDSSFFPFASSAAQRARLPSIQRQRKGVEEYKV
jgi:hypothetical protein